MTRSSRKPGMSFNNKLDKASAPNHQCMEEKKSSRKKRLSANSYRSAKRRRLSTKNNKTNDKTLGNSSIVEPQTLPNGVLSGSSQPKSQDLLLDIKLSEPDDDLDNLKIHGLRIYEAQSEAHGNSNGNQKIIPSLQITLMENAEHQSGPFLVQGDENSKSVQELSSTRAQGQTNTMVLRPRTQSITSKHPALANPREVIGRRIEVYWPVDSKYYCGVIRAYDSQRRKHMVAYDDGDVEWLSLSQESVLWGATSSAKPGEVVGFSNMQEEKNDQKLGVSTRKRVAGKISSDMGAAVADVKIRKDNASSSRKFWEAHTNHISKDGIGGVKCQAACVYMRKREKPRGRLQVVKDMETDGNTSSPSVVVDGRQLKGSARRQVQEFAKGEGRSTMSQVSVDMVDAMPGVNGRVVRRVKKTYKLKSLAQTHEAGAVLSGHEETHKEGVEISRERSITHKMELRGVGRKLFARNPLLGKKSLGVLRRRSKRIQARKKRPPPSKKLSSPKKRLKMTREKPKMRQSEGAGFFSGYLLLECQSSTLPDVQDFAQKPHATESCSHDPLEAFHRSMYLSRPAMPPIDLLPWCLFSMLRTMGLCGGEHFEGNFSWRGSTRDFANIALLLMSVIRSLPFDCQRHSQHWQGRMLHNFWEVVGSRGKPWARSLPTVLSPRADDLLMKHMRQLMKQGDGIGSLTFKQVLSLFICYIIKPFLIAVLRERGAQPTLVVQRFLVCIEKVLSFKRQSVKWVKLKPSGGGVEADFLTHLSHFPICRSWSAANGILHKLAIDQWYGSMANKCSRPLVLAPSFNFSSDQGLQFSTSIIKFMPVLVNHTSGLQMKNSGLAASVRTSCMDRLVFMEDAGDFKSILHSQSSLDLCTGLYVTSMMQKHLLTIGDWCGTHRSNKKPIPPPAKEDCMLKCFPHRREGMADDDGRLLVGQELSDVVRGTYLVDKCSSFMTNAIMMGRRMEVGNSSKPAVGADCETNDSMLSFRDSSSNSSSLEAGTRWKSTSMAKAGFKSINNMRDEHGTSLWYGWHGDGSQLSCAHASKKRSRSKRRPRQVIERDPKEVNGRESDPWCSANVLITIKDRSWREVAVKVDLQPNGNDWVIWVHREGIPNCHKVVDRLVTGKVNRHTHAIMWKVCDGWMLEFRDRKQWARFKRIHADCKQRNTLAALMRQIPIPSCRVVEESAESTPWSRVTFGTLKRGKEEVEASLTCTQDVYDLDSEDERWLEEMNGRAMDCIEEPISIETFEHIVDKLERITHLRQGHLVPASELAELCPNSAHKKAVLAVHAHWSKKRAAKDNSLIRCYQVPLWKKYQEQCERWESQVNAMRKQWPALSEEELNRRWPKPPMFSFCMRSRNLDTSNTSQRMQKQRPLKHLHPAFKHSRIPVMEFAEGLQSREGISLPEASLRGNDGSESVQSEHALGYGEMSYWARKKVEKVLLEQLALDLLSRHGAASECRRRAEEAQAKAIEARKVAAARAAKAQAQFLRFSLALQRAGAALIEFKTRYSAEAALFSIEWREASRKLLGNGPNHFLQLLHGDDRSLDDGSDNDGADGIGGHEQRPRDDNDDGHNDDYSWTDIEEDGFGERPSLEELPRDEAYSLSVSERANLEALMRSTLRQRAC